MKALLFSFWLLETVVLLTLVGIMWTAFIAELAALGLWGIVGIGALCLLSTTVTLGLSFLLFTLWRDWK